MTFYNRMSYLSVLRQSIMLNAFFENFKGRNFSVFCFFWSFSRKFVPLEIGNHGYFSKRESFFTINKIIKMGQFSKVMIFFYFYRQAWQIIKFTLA